MKSLNFEIFLPAGIDVSLYLRPTNCTEIDNVRSMKSNLAGGGNKIHSTYNFGRFCGID